MNTNCIDSYGEPILDGDILHDEVGNFFSYVARDEKYEWVMSHSPGTVFATQGHLSPKPLRRIKTYHPAETVQALTTARARIAELEAALENALAILNHKDPEGANSDFRNHATSLLKDQT